MSTQLTRVRGMAECDLPQIVEMARKHTAFKHLTDEQMTFYFRVVVNSKNLRGLVAESPESIRSWMVYRPDVDRFTILALSGHELSTTLELLECLLNTLGGNRRFADLLISDKPANAPMVEWATQRGLVRRYDEAKLIATFSVPRSA